MKYILITILFSLLVFASSLGDIDKGHTYYRYIINPMINIKGDKFTILHTKKEWKTLFSNNAKGFKREYSTINSDFKKFLSSQKFNDITKDLEVFFIYYAKDSDIKPQCGD